MKNKTKDKMELILERRKNLKTRSKSPIDSFITKWDNVSTLLKQIHKKISNKNLIQEARGQFIVSIVTALEVFLRDSLISLINKNQLDYTKLAEKKSDNYDLETVEFIIKNKITIAELIADNCSFQNLKRIDECFSLLFGFNLFKEFKDYKWVYDKEDSKGYIQMTDFYPKIDKLLKLRHDITHDLNFKRTINKRDLDEMEEELVNFTNILAFFFDDLMNKKLKISERLKFKKKK